MCDACACAAAHRILYAHAAAALVLIGFAAGSEGRNKRMQDEVHKGVRVKSSEHMRSRRLTTEPEVRYNRSHTDDISTIYLVRGTGLRFDVYFRGSTTDCGVLGAAVH